MSVKRKQNNMCDGCSKHVAILIPAIHYSDLGEFINSEQLCLECINKD
jgi:hypothetical protein